MGQFKPMVKMMTTEPSVVLKLKKGGSVKAPKMMDGGVMRGLAATPGARGGMNPVASPARPSMAMRRKAMMARPMMKEGGETKAEHKAEMSKMAGTEAKLKKHASLPASKAHKGLKTGGVVMGQGGFKAGVFNGAATTEKGAKEYVKTKVDTASGEHHTPKKTGDVAMGKPGGYLKGGSAKYAKGGGVMDNVSTSKPGPTGTTTGEVKKGNAGGYKKGGEAKKDSDVDLGYFNTVGRDGSPGGGKKGGAIKKHYATGGLVDSGRAVAMPKHFVSNPVKNNLQSGTFKKGGGVEKKAYGGAC